MIDYTIGDEIVKLVDGKYSKEGEVFIAKTLDSCCNIPIVFVGITDNTQMTVCSKCARRLGNIGDVWHSALNFKKLDTLVNIEELTEILELSF